MRKKIYYKDKPSKKTKLITWILAVGIPIIYYIINFFSDEEWLKDLMTDNLIIQSILLFFTLATALSLFSHFSFRKELNEEKTKKIAYKQAEEYSNDKKRYEEKINESSI
jgi:hypothetical protein